MYPLQIGSDNPILRKSANPILEINSDVIWFADDLLELMREYKGVGLAAPQVWQSIRMIATTQWKKGKKQDKLIAETIMINPEIIEHSSETFILEEGCLSLPDIQVNVSRYKHIVVRFLSTENDLLTMSLEWFNAAIVQHEIDHLNGILIVDKVKKWK